MLEGGGKNISGLFRDAVSGAETLDEVREGVIGVLNSVSAGGCRIGYVSGIITSDSREYVALNRSRLEGYTEYLRANSEFPVFSSNDIFGSEIEDRLGENDEKKWHLFWRDVLTMGNVTDIFMTPRWKSSAGAKDEHETAKRIGIEIHYMEDHPELNSIMGRHKK